ncbi:MULTISPECIES: ABC transporter substrate-binding protein [unclassified Duganella]|uniref:substrate-binding periplasmic protein n=1 Tax=unclassified Duganella TaxID=2636909 RepID=UPI00088F6F95|nr:MULTISPECIES: transporter substrate-binding domain-containing protein [unclassified Duganella]SDH15317.1 ABC-type amino acid transport substrate-binding protein [Duganella sp. OV458]SDK29820.1 ABC-type amino acid transport substrate-binding protein [Duganella sp. OV510]
MPGRRRFLLQGTLALASAATTPAWAAAPLVRYPQSEAEGQGQNAEHYPVRLLRMALARSGQDHQLQPSNVMMRQNRALAELRAGRVIDIAWTMASQQRERDLLPIRIPLDMGLIGWRLLLIRARDAARYAAIRQPGELQALDALQGHDWPDTDILRANHYRVQTASDYAGMFKMLQSGRVDYFPRAVFEVWNEAAAFADQGLVVAPGLALHYPSAFYFFVNKDNTALAASLQQGLEQLLADGSYARLFNEYYGDMVARSALDKRRVFELRNNLLSPATPLARRELWLHPGRTR